MLLLLVLLVDDDVNDERVGIRDHGLQYTIQFIVLSIVICIVTSARRGIGGVMITRDTTILVHTGVCDRFYHHSIHLGHGELRERRHASDEPDGRGTELTEEGAARGET